MKKNGIGLRFLPTLALAAFLAFSVPGTAQPDVQPDTAERLKVQHVRAAMMFWWLTGEKDKQEKVFDREELRIANMFTAQHKPTSLPGLRKLAFDSATNELIASGAQEDVNILSEVLKFLDRPARKVELQVQAIEIDEAYVYQGKWFAADPRAETTHSSEGTKFLPKIMPERIPQIVISDRRAEQFHSFISMAREQKMVGSIQTHRIEALNNSKARLIVEENALTLGWEMALTPTIQNDDTVTLFCSPLLKGQMIVTVANMRPKDVTLLLVRNLEQAGRVMIFVITVNSITPQPQ